MTEFGPDDVLFMGLGNHTHVAWYRCFLPARTLGCDWMGTIWHQDRPISLTGNANSFPKAPDFDSYKVIVVQQPGDRDWFKWIKERQKNGVKVIYEIDDDLHAISKLESHSNRKAIKNRLPDYELCMRASDALIVSTEQLKRKYSKFNKKIFVCEAGVDMERYALERPKRDPMNIGFTGGFGHEQTLMPWLNAVRKICDEGKANFISVGVSYADLTGGISVPTVAVEAYPGVLANFDVILAPSMHNNFFKAKSQLRWVESAAASIPLVADPFLYSEIQHGVDGLLATNEDEVYMCLESLTVAALRDNLGLEARNSVDRYHINNAVEQWITAFETVVD